MNPLEGSQLFPNPEFPFHIDRYFIHPKLRIPSHSHDFYEFVYVLNGGAIHEWSNHAYPLASGDVFAIEPNAYHSYLGAEDQETVVYNILFDKKLLQHEMENLLRFPAFIDFFYLAPFLRSNASFAPYTSLQANQRMQMEAQLQLIHEEYNQKREGFELIIKYRWFECLVLLSRFHAENGNAYTKHLSKEEWISSICNFIEQNCDQELSLSQVAKTCGMSISSFKSKFKQATGQSLIDYKHSIQIRFACQLLNNSTQKIASIGHDVGFNDISFFNRIFRKHMGMTPKVYRRNGRK